mmetsp:Transcript_34824/g.86392  ORF Transcript_34824/g.86392 Transcript_34824/m.86392 type:complete len:204 (+) Transcript_34824:1630-2241(+)
MRAVNLEVELAAELEHACEVARQQLEAVDVDDGAAVLRVLLQHLREERVAPDGLEVKVSHGLFDGAADVLNVLLVQLAAHHLVLSEVEAVFAQEHDLLPLGVTREAVHGHTGRWFRRIHYERVHALVEYRTARSATQRLQYLLLVVIDELALAAHILDVGVELRGIDLDGEAWGKPAREKVRLGGNLCAEAGEGAVRATHRRL